MQVFWRANVTYAGAPALVSETGDRRTLPAQNVGKEQRRDDGGIRLDDELGRRLAELAPGDLLVRHGAGVGTVTGCGITEIAEVRPQRHVLTLQILMPH